LNKSALARRAGVHHTYLVKLEQGRIERPSIDYIARIAGVLGVRAVDLTMDIPVVTTNGALRAELAPLGYEDDEMELVVDIVNQVARYSVPMRRRLLLVIQMLVTPSSRDDEALPLGLEAWPSAP
jgi:transcriptional regulator with XRE-family HTH domain